MTALEEEFDPSCDWILDETAAVCGADGTVFAIGEVALVPDGRFGTDVVRRRRTPTLFVCPTHLLAAVVAREDDPWGASLVMPVAEHPLRGRPPK